MESFLKENPGFCGTLFVRQAFFKLVAIPLPLSVGYMPVLSHLALRGAHTSGWLWEHLVAKVASSFQQSSCLRLPSAGIVDVCYQALL